MLGKIKSKLKTNLHLGSYPDFLIIGAAKCGTTSLLKYLKDYGSNFAQPIKKEIRYFSEFPHLSKDWYKSHFPTKFFPNLITGEATPDYLYYHKSPFFISNFAKVRKFVVILRNPSDRAYSQYCHQNHMLKTNVADPLSFSKAIRSESERFYVDKHSIFYREYKFYSYLDRGKYYEQIKRWFNYFPRECFYFMFLEDLELNLKRELFGLMDFLNINYNNKLIKNTKFNSSQGDKMLKEDRDFLNNYFRDENINLFKLLGEKERW